MLIGDLAARSGVSARMLRHYDRIGLLTPSRLGEGGYRHYSADDVRRLFCIEALRSLGLRLEAVGQALTDPAFDPRPVIDQLVAEAHERRARDADLIERLSRVRAVDPSTWGDVLDVTTLLRGLSAADGSVRQRRALDVGRDGQPAPEVLVCALLDEPDPNVRGALMWALTRTGDGAVPVLAAALDEEDPERRQRALAALVEIGTGQATGVLSGALQHSDPVVARRAALHVGGRGDLAAVPTLVAAVVDGHDDVDAAEMLGVLARRHDREDAVARALASQLPRASPAARRRIVGALAEVPGPVATSTLDRLLSDPDAGVALTAGAVLRRRG